MLAAFKIFDPDGSGSISYNEILGVMNLNGDSNSQECLEFSKIMSEIDQDGNGEIDLEEFK